MQTSFKYKRSFRTCYRGCLFHSLLELKFVLSIEEDFHFLREYITIWYDPKTMLSTNYITERTGEYKPDFLIRDKLNNTAYLVEIKPRQVNCERQLALRTQVAENYISYHNYDWKFIILYDDEIFLNDTQQKKFGLLRRYKESFSDMLNFEKLDNKFNNQPLKYHKSVPFYADQQWTPQDYIRLVKYGKI